jgi:teichuronic acid biosynthesis glycosyltransferase TuaG
MPRVSVIVPVHNAASTVAETLRSVVDQTYRDWEVVVTDDCSDDESASVAEAVSPRIRVVRLESNRGPAQARNLAVEHATGELLAFLDADDLWLPEYLESQVREFDLARRRRGDVGIVACDAYLEDPPGHRLSATYRRLVPFPPSVTVETLLEANPIYVSALAPAQIVRDVGGFDPRTFGSEDHDLWLKIVERGLRVVDNPRVLAVYRISAASVSARRVGMARTSQTTYRLALERGRLSRSQERLARRQIRLHAAVEAIEELLDDRCKRHTPLSTMRLTRSLATFACFAITHPRRWGRWLRAAARGRAVWRTGVR